MATKYRIPKPGDIQDGINAFDDLADTIANPPAGRPLKQAIGQAGRLYCDFVGSQPGQAILPWTGQGLVAPLLCRPYWDSQGYDAPVSTPPFEGGQCDGQLYIGRYEYGSVQEPNSVAGEVIFRARGPLSLGLQDAGSGAGVALYHRGAFPVNQGTGLYDCNQPFIPDLVAPTFTLTVNNSRNGRMVALQPCGFADNCGDPPGVLVPGPNPPPTPTFPPGQEPGFEPDGQPFFFVPPIDNPIGGDPIDVPPQPDPDPPDPGPPGDDTPTDPGDAGDPEETGPGGEASGVAPDGSELTGVFIEIVEFPQNAARFQNNQRQPFRGAGYIAMGWPNLLGVDMSGGVINLQQFFHAQQRGITAWRVTANIGFTLRCTPYYRELNPEEGEE